MRRESSGGFVGLPSQRAHAHRFCRHPLCLNFIVVVLGMDVLSRSALGLVFTLLVPIPGIVYRAKVEDMLLREEFGEEWNRYADEVGIPPPKAQETDQARF